MYIYNFKSTDFWLSIPYLKEIIWTNDFPEKYPL